MIHTSDGFGRVSPLSSHLSAMSFFSFFFFASCLSVAHSSPLSHLIWFCCPSLPPRHSLAMAATTSELPLHSSPSLPPFHLEKRGHGEVSQRAAPPYFPCLPPQLCDFHATGEKPNSGGLILCGSEPSSLFPFLLLWIWPSSSFSSSSSSSSGNVVVARISASSWRSTLVIVSTVLFQCCS